MRWTRWLPFLAVIGLTLLVYGLGAYHFSLETLRNRADGWLASVAVSPVRAPLFFMAITMVLTVIPFPASLLSVCAGFFFGQVGTAYVVAGETIGAGCLFLAARYALEELFRRYLAFWHKPLRQGFARHEISYLLGMRCIPLIPRFLLNVLPALFGVRLRTYLWTTPVGLLIPSIAYVQVGIGLATAMSEGLPAAFSWKLNCALACVACLCFSPILWRKLSRN
jgi:uncharacterized membrane protein YdjX (TVP38/TMEM64 family)